MIGMRFISIQDTLAGSVALAVALLSFASSPAVAEEPGAAAPEAATPTATSTAAVDTVTVVGTPRTPYTPVSGPQVEAPGWRTSDPGVPQADTTTYSSATSSAPLAASTRTPVTPGGGRAERGKIPWWWILIGAAAIAVAAGS